MQWRSLLRQREKQERRTKKPATSRSVVYQRRWPR